MKMYLMFGFVLALILMGATGAGAASASFQVATNNFYLAVGDYDYLPYAYELNPRYSPPRIDFVKVMGQYGRWVNVDPFGQCWQPYASAGWRPYAWGHWIYTDYGPYWEGYEPWAWVAYHYGSWVFDVNLGWIWVAGYDWYPSRVIWARGYDTIGWMPMPPDGYDYERGRCVHVGPHNQFTYSDSDFDFDFGAGPFTLGGPYYNAQARDMFYNPAYAAIQVNLWVFIDNKDFDDDNYADHELGPDYSHYIFDQRAVRVTNRPVAMRAMQTITRQPIEMVQVDTHQLKTNRGTVKVVVPAGPTSAERVYRESPQVVRHVIAPAFAKEGRQFKGKSSKIQAPVAKVFKQENVKPKIQKQTREQVINSATQAQKNREQTRAQNMEAARQRTETYKQQGKIVEPGAVAKPGMQQGMQQGKAGEVGRPAARGRPAEQGKAPAKPETAPKPGEQKQNPPPSHGGR